MFYRINNSLDKKQIGKYPQVVEGIYHIHVGDPHFIGNHGYEYIVEEVSVPGFKLAAKAKPTDFVSASIMGMSGRRLISNKLKKIIEHYSEDRFQFFETYIIDKNNKLGSYWIINPYHFNDELIDFEKSIIWVIGLGGVKLRALEVNSAVEYKNIIGKFELPEGPYIEKVVLKESSLDFFALKDTITGIDYFISKRLKIQIEEAGCTGIEFESVG